MSAEQARLHELLLQKQEMLKVDRLRNFDPYPFQVEYMSDMATEIGLRAANQIGKCVSYQTLIDTTKGKKKIGDIFGTECEVLTYPDKTPKRVLSWIKKPKEECFRITLYDGQWIEAPKNHRILVGDDYRFVYELLQELPESVFCQHQSSSGLFRSAHVLSVLRLIGKVRDCLCDCLVDFRLHDVQPRVDIDNVEVYPPSQAYVQRHIDYLSHLGDLARKGIGILYDKLSLLSNLGGVLPILGRFVLRLYPSFAYADLYMNENSQNGQQFSLTEYRHRSSDGLHCHQYLDCTLESPDLKYATNKIVSVVSVGYKTLYDMEVEDVHNYIAGGMVNHNTLSGCAWDAYDLTGLYPDWWKGFREESPIVLVAGCINNDKTRDVLQRELFGDPIEWEKELGTGWIPKNCIGKIQKKRGVPDAFYNVRIKHHDKNGKFDGWSKIVFLAYEMGKATWMGHKANVTHLDEEPPEEILDQASRSSIATGGRTRVTWTPENGMTKVVKMVEESWSMHTAEWMDVAGEDFTVNVEGDDFEFKTIHTLKGRAGHLTKVKVEAAQRKILPYQMKMRMRGIPVLGSGLVFAYAEEQFKHEQMEFPEHFIYIDAIDFGGLSSTAHPTAFIRLAYDPQMDIIYLYDAFRMTGKEIPEIASHIIMKPNSDVIPVIWPHDGNKVTGQGETTKNQYLNAGVNMFMGNGDKSHFTNPPDEMKIEGSGGIQIMPGITEMSTRISDGRFFVMDNVNDFFEEYRGYHMKDGKIVDVDDDIMSAARYGVQSIRHAVTLVKKHKKLNMLPTNGWLS